MSPFDLSPFGRPGSGLAVLSPRVVRFLAWAGSEQLRRLEEQARAQGGGRVPAEVAEAVRVLVTLAQQQPPPVRGSAERGGGDGRAASAPRGREVGSVEAARLLGVSREQVSRWGREGRLPARRARPGRGPWLFDLDDVLVLREERDDEEACW